MRINQNISAMNTYSRLTSANTGKSSSLAKLSSGLRINKAGDDAAGLAISEKMRGQVGGLKQSVRNAQDGISLIQTAEGALNETHSILNRMRDLAVQSSNGTNTESDRGEIQKEMNQLADEISRIADTTQFNTQELLDGSFKTKFHIGANTGQSMELQIGNLGAEALGVDGAARTISGTEVSANIGTDIKVTATDGKEYNVIINAGTGNGSDENINVSGDTVTITMATTASGGIANDLDDIVGFINDIDGLTAAFLSGAASGGTAATATAASGVTLAEKDITVQVAATEGGINVSTQEAADTAIKIIDDAVLAVSSERSKLGSVQNRLEHTINNLTATAENLSAAESRIRDVDMAEEMMEFTKNNILSQAATAMLAQANQMPNSVLQLLQ